MLMRRILQNFILVVLLILISATVVFAHSFYDHECCHDRDCAPAKDVKYLDDGTIIVQIVLEGKLHTITYPKDFPREKIKSSKDERVHGCAFVRSNPPDPLCLYLPAGS